MNDAYQLSKAPDKRPFYELGMVLGVDDLNQEQYYFLEKGRIHNRALHGYGTVSGLHVSCNGDLIRISPGLAVDSLGRNIHISTEQCAHINKWLKRNGELVSAQLGSPPNAGPLSLFVILKYRECKTDIVPIPGKPCRTDEESMSPSRVQDDFELFLCLDPPMQLEEDAVKRFGDLLRRIEMASATDAIVPEEDFYQMVRTLDDNAEPSNGQETLYLASDSFGQILDRAFRIWATEIRPKLLQRGRGCDSGSDDDPVVLLAQLDFNVQLSNEQFQLDGNVSINEDDRPVLLHTRLLQEWLLSNRIHRKNAHTFATLSAKPPRTIRAWVHYPELVDIPAEAVTLFVDDASQGIQPQIDRPVQSTNVFDLQIGMDLTGDSRVRVCFNAKEIMTTGSQPKSFSDVLQEENFNCIDREGDTLRAYLNLISHRGLTELGEDDHKHYFNEGRGDERYSQLNHSHKLKDLTDVSDVVPIVGEVLTWSSSNQWEPDSGLGLEEIAQELPTLPFSTIKRIPAVEGYPTFKAWFHLNASASSEEANLPELQAGFMPALFGETDADPYLKEIKIEDCRRSGRNEFQIRVDRDVNNFNFLRFVFPLERMEITFNGNQMPLIDWLQQRPVKWLGHDGKDSVTVFYENQFKSNYEKVAAGRVSANGRVGEPNFRLTAERLEGYFENENMFCYRVSDPDYNPENAYVVSALLMVKNDEKISDIACIDQVEDGILIRVTAERAMDFMVEISRIY